MTEANIIQEESLKNEVMLLAIAVKSLSIGCQNVIDMMDSLEERVSKLESKNARN